MKILEMDLQELGLIEDETSQEETILKTIIAIQTSENGNEQKLQLILDYVAEIASQRHMVQFPSISGTAESVNVTSSSSSLKHEAVIVQTEDQEYQFTWIGTRDVSINNVIQY